MLRHILSQFEPQKGSKDITMNKIKAPKKRSEHVMFDEPLIAISMEPTEEVDPLFIDPTAESINNDFTDIEDEFTLNKFSIFSPKVIDVKRRSFINVKGKEELKVKEEAVEADVVKIKDEPRDPDDFELDLPKEAELDPVEAFAQVLDKIEYLCPKCTFRSIDKEEVTQHFVSSHRVFQIGIPRPCDKCDFVGKTVRELANHKKSKHPRTYFQDRLPTLPTGEFKCPHCDFNSFHKNNVRSHLKVHTQDTVYTCDKCPYTAISRLNIENHAARHLVKSNKKWKFKCPHCGLLERTEKLLQRHLILHGEGEMVKCQLCPYKSPYTHIISMHTRICHGIITKRTYDKEEKWKLRVRKSTRKCARKTYTEEQDFDYDEEEEFFELPVKKTNRGRKKRKIDDTDNNPQLDEIKTEPEDLKKQEEGKSLKSDDNSNLDKTVEDMKDTLRRPTLEERLGRARELINQRLSKKKRKNSEEQDEETVQNKKEIINKKEEKPTESPSSKSEEENPSDSEEDSDSNSENQSDEEGTVSKGEDWSDEEFSDAMTEESLQSFTSDKHTLGSNSLPEDSMNSITNPESLMRMECGEGKRKRGRPSKTKNVMESNNKNYTAKESLHREVLAEQLKLDNATEPNQGNPSSTEKQDETLESKLADIPEKLNESSTFNKEDGEDSVPAVLVLKRNGTSFTCIPKSNSDSN